jgi:hypothetical protein
VRDTYAANESKSVGVKRDLLEHMNLCMSTVDCKTAVQMRDMFLIVVSTRQLPTTTRQPFANEPPSSPTEQIPSRPWANISRAITGRTLFEAFHNGYLPLTVLRYMRAS